jgi:hypothetical protein
VIAINAMVGAGLTNRQAVFSLHRCVAVIALGDLRVIYLLRLHIELRNGQIDSAKSFMSKLIRDYTLYSEAPPPYRVLLTLNSTDIRIVKLSVDDPPRYKEDCDV